MSELTPKEQKKIFGQTKQAIPCTRVLRRNVGDPENFNNEQPVSILAINDAEGTFTQANVYGMSAGGHLGKNYDPVHYTHPLPAEGDAKWKEWTKRGYEEGKVSDFRMLTQVEVKAKAKKPKEAKETAEAK
jgi:hypothetical protein